jgi:hypothetical protein
MLIVILVLAIMAFVYVYMQQPKFGNYPRNERLEKIKASPNFKNGQFQNLSPTPALTEGSELYWRNERVLFRQEQKRHACRKFAFNKNRPL